MLTRMYFWQKAPNKTPQASPLHLLLSICCFIVCMLALPTHHAMAETNRLMVPIEDAEQWSLEADKLSSLGNNTIVEAEGGVLLRRGKDILKADFARLYVDTNWVFLKGNVFVRMGRDDLTADEAEFDLTTRTGWLVNGHVFIEGPHMYMSGDLMTKHWGDRYSFENAKITTCDGEDPDWAVRADEIVVEIDGYAQLSHSSVLIKNQPVMYSPYLILPAKTTRQSGFLKPDYGYSTKLGVYYTQPYFWAMDESRDMTFYAGFMSEVGPLVGVQYRSHPFTTDKTSLTFSGIYDRNTITTQGANSFYNEGYLRTNNERFWLRGMSDGHIGTTGWRYRANLDYVSDQDYLQEFNDGPLGFETSQDELFAMFGRDLQEEGLNRISEVLVYKDWERFGVAASLRYEQNMFLGHGNASSSTDTLVQQLPNLSAYWYKGRIFENLPLEFEAQASSAYMYRQSGTSGLRSEIYPKISLPMDFGFASVIASAGLRQTYYTNERSSDNSIISTAQGSDQDSTTRTIPEFNIQGYTQLSKVWNVNGNAETLAERKPTVGAKETVAYRHEIQPRIQYSYTSFVDQEDNPYYITDDRLLRTNELTYSITNTITRKQARVVPAPKTENNTQTASPENPNAEKVENSQVPLQVAYDYVDIVRWRLASGYSFTEANRNTLLDEYPRKPFFDVLSDLEIFFTPWMSYDSKLFISPHTGDITRYDHTLTFTVPKWGKWRTGLSFRDENYDYINRVHYDDPRNIHLARPVHLLQNHLTLNLNSNWSVNISDYRDLREGSGFGETYDQSIDLVYNDQCYRFIGRYTNDGYDESFSIYFEIPGLFE